ncbi:unnamed protein product [Darwinula stevensoni]|uniref:Uncharacterized protein n=1 Tax=Darwinula stevensoni TaxID=69355 RepID=A0A7R9A3J0_9CRUS|nr:unnamed protein product [Darwinula stevensoni]CAG0882235.1 unnamed protein product [Darwinula stevensoni]
MRENPIGGGGGGGGGCGGVTNLFPAFPASIAALYTSPSLPNISLGRPPAPPASISTAHATALAAAINHVSSIINHRNAEDVWVLKALMIE